MSLMILEMVIRIYKPFGFRVRGNTIELPTNKHYIHDNLPSDKLDAAHVRYTRNSIGLRGDDPPGNFGSYITLITVGGSTTDGIMLDDEDTWTAVLGRKLALSLRSLWINNAGLDGHSTYGHLVLVKDYIAHIQPKYVFFLIGANEIGMRSKRSFDTTRYTRIAKTAQGIFSFFEEKLEIVSLIHNMLRFRDAQKRGLVHNRDELEHIALGDRTVDLTRPL